MFGGEKNGKNEKGTKERKKESKTRNEKKKKHGEEKRSQMTATATMTTNIHGEQIVVTTTKQYKAVTFQSKMDHLAHPVNQR